MLDLRDALDGVPGHRKSQGRRHPLGAVLSLAVCAIPRSSRGLKAWSLQLVLLSPVGAGPWIPERATLGVQQGEDALCSHLPPGVQGPGRGRPPFRPRAGFEAVLWEWLISSGVDPGQTLSLDGKTLRGIHGEAIAGVHPVSAYAAQSGAAVSSPVSTSRLKAAGSGFCDGPHCCTTIRFSRSITPNSPSS